MHTKQQAKELFCPVARSGDDALCIASRCMAWRWLDAPRPRFFRAENREAKTVEESGGPARSREILAADDWKFIPWDGEDDPQDAPAGWRETEESVQRRRAGYCGMAGKPF